jgi:serine/threonine-protein kinase
LGNELAQPAGDRIPGYQLLEKLGQGAMGTVYKARQISMNRLVAIKVLLPRLAADPEFMERIQREAHLAAKLSHNNIIQAIDVGVAGKIHYFVMEYVEGTSLRKELLKGRSFSEREAVDITLQVARALQHAWKRGLIHRDIKPANIVLTPEGVVKLADLGMARETSDWELAKAEGGLAIGTPYYMAPEQIEGDQDIDVRADIYSLGATLYHLVTGQPPFPGKNVDQVLDAHLKEELVPPDHINTSLSAGLGEVVEFMMVKDRRQRYQTPDDLILDLELLLRGERPKLVNQRPASGAIQGLEEGEAEGIHSQSDNHLIVWLIVLGLGLVASLLLNLVLLMRS